jgi:hypothetical protein
MNIRASATNYAICILEARCAERILRMEHAGARMVATPDIR